MEHDGGMPRGRGESMGVRELSDVCSNASMVQERLGDSNGLAESADPSGAGSR